MLCLHLQSQDNKNEEILTGPGGLTAQLDREIEVEMKLGVHSGLFLPVLGLHEGLSKGASRLGGWGWGDRLPTPDKWVVAVHLLQL
jgi:hypothetical protein